MQGHHGGFMSPCHVFDLSPLANSVLISFYIVYEADTGLVCTPIPKPRDILMKANNFSLKILVHYSLTEAGKIRV